jgi:predicted MFS family arabinose efflux permease
MGREQGRTVGTGRGWRDAALVPSLVAVGAMVAIISSLGAPLIPTIAAQDHVSLSTAQWLLTAALLTGALVTPVLGRLADGTHQRDVIVLALGVVVLGSVLAAVSNSFVLLVVGRGLQGVGLGLLPVTMAIARSHLPTEKAARTIATLSITTAIGIGLGYPITSAITELFNYHAAFWFGAFATACALALVALVVPPNPGAHDRRFDVIGVVNLSLVVIGLSVILSEAGGWGWTSLRVLAIGAVCIVLLALWIPHELRAEEPLVDLRQVKNRSVLMADVAGFLICVSMYLFLPVLVEFVQIPAVSGYGFGASVVVAGFMLVPLSVGTFVSSRFLPAFSHRFGTRPMIPLGSLVFAAAMLFFALDHTSIWQAFLAVGMAGIGMGFTFAAMPGFIVRAVPPHETGSATGFYQVLRSIGLSVGSALSAAVLSVFTHKGNTLPEARGFEVALLIGVGLCVLTAVLSYVIPGRVSTGRALSAHETEEVDELMEENAELGGVMLGEEALSEATEAGAR